ncbi:hypothetical protein C5167_033536 [Papaver somniferum]|uniref:t-SNARE coiled-coil homology domain-containing protein n=1 Tax=Papaver somniferum TaxID=3469 RepID=A0A4Y7KBU7_PAPSO|nr:hypothetical protein C5167_033536 [Papaver somniferum]
MSTFDILFRVESICKKYEKHDVDKQRELMHPAMILSLKSEAAAIEKNRAAAVAMNAEVRRTKARLMEDLTKLQRLAGKKAKGITREELATRNDLVMVLAERVQAIPDSATTGANKSGGWGSSASKKGIKFDTTSDMRIDDEFFQHTEESNQFRQEYEDEGLDIISQGLNTLKDTAHDMNEELDRQVPLIDEIDTKVDRATSDLKNTNVRLKQTINQIRSSRNIIIDIILLCIILGIASYLYNILK